MKHNRVGTGALRYAGVPKAEKLCRNDKVLSYVVAVWPERFANYILYGDTGNMPRHTLDALIEQKRAIEDGERCSWIVSSEPIAMDDNNVFVAFIGTFYGTEKR